MVTHLHTQARSLYEGKCVIEGAMRITAYSAYRVETGICDGERPLTR